MIDRTVIEPLGDRALDCVCGPVSDWEWLASLVHGWPLMFTAVAAAAFVVLLVLLVVPAIERHRGDVDTHASLTVSERTS
ncbi:MULTISPECIES: hypothetical protein [Nocardiaceae]|jgi:negative regulator of sigma E activity|uniref:hypothetical protein n=1 Tax=Nocardiaceae TaxID=85025 RepID=UPI00050C9DC5|nr:MULTISPECIES: hypothetical protein [Rhodococcus]AMY56346.1 hypothetical protein A3L23_05048 [Rhodococcus fascians D188]AMY56506.1 hypothetical protein A3L23_05208 [Rhodococcus fascians D188]